jgi:excisionase family DNA binding protein
MKKGLQKLQASEQGLKDHLMLTIDEAAELTGFKRSYLYRLTNRKLIPYYKPLGKKVFFKCTELEQWLQTNRISTDEELRMKAAAYCMNMKGGSL